MGLITWKNAPKGTIRKTDVGIAKNYLNKQDILTNAGKVSAEIAKTFAENEYETNILVCCIFVFQELWRNNRNRKSKYSKDFDVKILNLKMENNQNAFI